MAMMINPPHKNIPHVLDKAKNLTIIRLSFYLVITMTLMTTPQSTHDYLIEILTPLAESSDIAQALLHIITHNQLSDELLQSLKTIVNESVHHAIKESEKDLLV